MEFTTSDYVMRISNSTPVQLVVITYEITLDYIAGAKKALLANNDKEFRKNLSQAQAFMQELMANLNMTLDISWELLSLYLYINKLLIQSGAGNHPEPLDDAKKILNNLLVSWQEIEKQEADKTPVLSNTQQVFAGLTYGRGGLDEFVPEDSNRGFKA